MRDIKDLIDELNATDETVRIEAKKGSAIDKSILETVCAFANEPGLGGGYILLGVERDASSLFPTYTVTGVEDPDKLQLDLGSQCATVFSQAIRPRMEVEHSANGNVLKVWVDELPQAQKPVYFKNEGLPKGAVRRIGSSDQRCTEDDMMLFYNHHESFDNAIIKDSSWDDVDESAIDYYRKLRARVNESAEELTYNDRDLLYALSCLKKENGEDKLTVAGLQLFGSRMAQRRLTPALRVDYIRVPGNEWVQDPDDRFTTIDMRGSLMLTLQRAYTAVVDDLPKGFLLPEGELQAQSVGLPGRVLREALVNALMHRSFRVNQPIQIIRYGNRIEIKNPGYSLKTEEALGEPGSEQRNPHVAAVFHETNLAETKGSGIRTMRNLMQRSGMAPPTFDSDHSKNEFTVRLLLHHFLSEEDLEWLDKFKELNLNEDQKKALVFVREVGAIDNVTYRQLSGADVLRASSELRTLRQVDLIVARGKGRATYYVPGSAFTSELVHNELDADNSGNELVVVHRDGNGIESAPPQGESALPHNESAPPLIDQIPVDIRKAIEGLGAKAGQGEVEDIIVRLCGWKELKAIELADILGRSDKYVLRKFITPLRQSGRIQYTIPDMENHPDQAYRLPT